MQYPPGQYTRSVLRHAQIALQRSISRHHALSCLLLWLLHPSGLRLQALDHRCGDDDQPLQEMMIHLRRILRDQSPNFADISLPRIFRECAEEEDDLGFDYGGDASRLVMRRMTGGVVGCRMSIGRSKGWLRKELWLDKAMNGRVAGV